MPADVAESLMFNLHHCLGTGPIDIPAFQTYSLLAERMERRHAPIPRAEAIPGLVYLEGKPQSRRDHQGAATSHEFRKGSVILELL